MHSDSTVHNALALQRTGLTQVEIAAQLGVPRSTVKDWLGDGCLSEGAGGVYRVRICLDLRYPPIIEECAAAIGDAVPANRVSRLERYGRFKVGPDPTLVEVSAYSKEWIYILPQHGPGRKHCRPIQLEPWQTNAVESDPEKFLRGLSHSDGCRFINTGTNWRNPRYGMYNLSEDILRLFEGACELLDLHTTRAPGTVYVSRKADVARMDEFIGPKR